MSDLKLNGHPVSGHAVLEVFEYRYKRIWAALTICADSPVYQIARQAVLAGSFEVVLEGAAHEPKANSYFNFKAEGQLVNGRVGSEIKADFKSTSYVEIAAVVAREE